MLFFLGNPFSLQKDDRTHMDEDDNEAPIISLHGGSQLVGKY